MTDKTLQDRLRQEGPSWTVCNEAADALDAQADKINRLSARSESQRIKIEEQAERIKALEGALRGLLSSLSLHDEEGLMEHAEPVERARAALKEEPQESNLARGIRLARGGEAPPPGFNSGHCALKKARALLGEK